MSNSVTADTLWSRALDYADMTGSSFPDTNRKYDLLNAGMSKLHNILANSEGEYVTGAPSTISVVAGTATYALPTDFYKALKLYRVENNRYYVVRRWSREMADGLLTAPTQSATLHLFYIPHVTLLTTGSSTVAATYPPGWEDYIALDVAIRLLTKEESLEQAMVLTRQRDDLMAQMRAFAEPRDSGEPHQVADVYGRWADPWRNVIGNPAGRSTLYYRLDGANLRIIEADPAGYL